MSVFSSLFDKRLTRTSLLSSKAEAQLGQEADPKESLAQREKFYQVVRDSMVRAGVLSTGYKFKAMPRDRMGASFLVMIDLAPTYLQNTAQLREIETQMGHLAKLLVGTQKVAVYWRLDESLEIPVQLASGMRMENTPASFDPIQPAEIAAYKNGGTSMVQPLRHASPDTALDLGTTQYGDLR